jgi:hypothetical protein
VPPPGASAPLRDAVGTDRPAAEAPSRPPDDGPGLAAPARAPRDAAAPAARTGRDPPRPGAGAVAARGAAGAAATDGAPPSCAVDAACPDAEAPSRRPGDASTADREGRAPSGRWPRPPACLRAVDLALPPEGARVAVCGLVIVRQRPGSAKGVIFVTLEDETGVVNVVIWTRVYEAHRRAVIAGRLLRVTGRVQRDGQVVHVVAERIEDVSALLDRLAAGARALDPALARADEVRRPQEDGSRRPKTGPEARAQGLIRAAPRAMHPREQAKRLIRRPDGPPT